MHEIEEALDREAEEGGKVILIPVALDEVLEKEWWLYEPNKVGEPILGQLDGKELTRRKTLAKALTRRVVGDLKNSKPRDEKWKTAIDRLTRVL